MIEIVLIKYVIHVVQHAFPLMSFLIYPCREDGAHKQMPPGKAALCTSSILKLLYSDWGTFLSITPRVKPSILIGLSRDGTNQDVQSDAGWTR